MSQQAGAFKRFLRYYRPHMGLFWADTAAALAMAAIDLSFPQILRACTGGLFTQGPEVIYATLGYLAIGLTGLYALRIFCRYFVTAWGHIMGARMESTMRQDLFNQYEKFSFADFDRHNTGDLMSRLVSDLFDISEAAHHGPEWAVVCSIEMIGSFVLLSFISWKLSIILFVLTLVLGLYSFRANRRMNRIFMENRRRISHVNSQLEDSLAGARVVKSFANEAVEGEKFAQANEAYLESKAASYKATGRYQAVTTLLTSSLYAAVLLAGGWLVASGDLHAQDLATYALYVVLFTSPVETLILFMETFQKASTGFTRFNEMLQTMPDIVDAPNAQPIKIEQGAISFDHVEFAYPDASNERVIHDLSLKIEPGKTVALVGPSGGGKSTICSLVPRFYDVASGSITIDGQDVREVTQESLRRAIGIVQQDVYLFNGSIGENIAYGRVDATFEEVVEAARKANIHDFIESLPEGYDTYVGERGSRLSGGQKQRIAIARVFLKDPSILILDEATSALDNESERAVQQSLSELSRGRTTLIIAHRLSTIRSADVIAAVENGRVVEMGSHDKLLEAKGLYARYYRMQFEGVLD